MAGMLQTQKLLEEDDPLKKAKSNLEMYLAKKQLMEDQQRLESDKIQEQKKEL